MSLLIKALEQAAKDRKANPVEPSIDLEPRKEPAHERSYERSAATAGVRESAAQRVAATPAGGSHAAGLAHDPALRERRPTSLAALAATDAEQQRARAATVMQAAGGSAAHVLALLRTNPVMLIGALAVLFGIGFGIYVYLQISQPGLFVRQVATRPQQTSAPPAPPAPTSAVAPLETSPPAAPLSAAGDLGTPAAAASSGSIGTPPDARSATSPEGAALARSSAPVATAAVIGAAPVSQLPAPAAAERPRERGSVRAPEPEMRPSAPRAAAAVAAAGPAAAPAERERIVVTPSTTQPRLNPMLAQAYRLLQDGELDQAQALYSRVSQAEPLNIDALLGLAYIAAQENRSDDATKLYLRILQLNPRHAVAQAALIGVMGRADPAASESRLRQLIAREPSAFLHFVLGNLYADQSMWAQAQQSYFQAHHLEPSNADYAYNLAVGLDHLRQRKLALNYYRRAEELAGAQSQSNFNLAHARDRIRVLASELE